nr:hypothetical protein Iba_chr11aCG9880 [Ipomoea batatas]
MPTGTGSFITRGSSAFRTQTSPIFASLKISPFATETSSKFSNFSKCAAPTFKITLIFGLQIRASSKISPLPLIPSSNTPNPEPQGIPIRDSATPGFKRIRRIPTHLHKTLIPILANPVRNHSGASLGGELRRNEGVGVEVGAHEWKEPLARLESSGVGRDWSRRPPLQDSAIDGLREL